MTSYWLGIGDRMKTYPQLGSSEGSMDMTCMQHMGLRSAGSKVWYLQLRCCWCFRSRWWKRPTQSWTQNWTRYISQAWLMDWYGCWGQLVESWLSLTFQCLLVIVVVTCVNSPAWSVAVFTYNSLELVTSQWTDQHSLQGDSTVHRHVVLGLPAGLFQFFIVRLCFDFVHHIASHRVSLRVTVSNVFLLVRLVSSQNAPPTVASQNGYHVQLVLTLFLDPTSELYLRT